MIYRWHGYGVDAMAVARPNGNNYLFLPGQSSLLKTIAHHELGLHLINKLY